MAACQKVLSDNRRGDYTIPAGKLYPHQWLWDSCFTAIGLSHYDLPAAQRELTGLLRGQWVNGMLPNMIFASGWRYTIDRFFWNSRRNSNAPRDVATSGITQPPMLTEAVVQVGNKLSAVERRAWYQQMLPALVAYHQWLYTERDPKNEGLMLQIHPYESGLDNTPPWVAELHDYHKPWWLSAAKRLPIDFVINHLRRDTKHVPANQRISNLDALLYHDILWRFRRQKYQIDKILPHDKFLIEDLTFNCIAIRANKHLQTIAAAIDQQLPDKLLVSVNRAELALEKLWDPDSQEYYSRSYNTDRLLKDSTIACLMPLYSGAISPERAKLLVAKLHDTQTYNAMYGVPSVAQNSKWFSVDKYWQGPSWINTNWLIMQGLRQYGFAREAEELISTSLSLVSAHGCYEYFSPLDGSPSGAQNFSWTAALTIDLIEAN